MSTVPEPIDEAPCVVCKEPIRRGAKVCIHCDRAQDWTRYLLKVGSITGVVIALLSLGSAAQSLRELVPDPATLSLVAKSCKRDGLELAIVNLGDKPALLRTITLDLKVGGTMANSKVLLTAIDGSELIGPGANQIVKYGAKSAGATRSLPTTTNKKQSCTYVVEVKTLDFESNEKPYILECDCPAD